MGGFALYDADKSFLRVLDEHTFEELNQTGEIEWPTITENEIQDRSKADIFSKGIVLIQMMWFVVQCISRFATKLTVTELEVVTLAFAVLNGITYWLWWDKPSDVRCAVPIYLKSAESSNPKVSKARQQRDTSRSSPSNFLAPFERKRDEHGLFFAIVYTLLWAPIKVVLNPLSFMMGRDGGEIPDNHVTRVPTFYSPVEEAEVLGFAPSFWTMIGVVVLFGAIHFIPWSFTFPNASERWLWRASAILITGGPLLPMFLGIIAEWALASILSSFWDFIVDSIEDSILYPILKLFLGFMIFIPIAAYIGSRMILLILPLMLLRNLPPAALQELKWSEFFPHI